MLRQRKGKLEKKKKVEDQVICEMLKMHPLWNREVRWMTANGMQQ